MFELVLFYVFTNGNNVGNFYDACVGIVEGIIIGVGVNVGGDALDA